jgi:hypothetical protein
VRVTPPISGRGKTVAGQQFTDRLFAAVEARLAEQAARADALATRAGIMVAAIAVAASLLAGQVGSDSKVLWATYAALGTAAMAGILVLCMARLTGGPSAAQLTLWGSQVDDQLMTELFAAKVLSVETNQAVLARVELLFYAQAAATAAATGLTLIEVGRR